VAPLTPPNPVYPDVPTLILGGDEENTVPLEADEAMRELYPNSQLVVIAGLGHPALYYSCGQSLISRFVGSLEVGDTSCAENPELVWSGVGRVPLKARGARPAEADPKGNNQANALERKVATIVAATVKDVMWRGEARGHGLRGGTYQTEYRGKYGYNVVGRLDGVGFTKDVSVSGVVHWLSSGELRAHVVVAGPGASDGVLTVDGYFVYAWPVDMLKIRGSLGGDRVAVLVPGA
jgi:hypothetical protein